jgi:branched-chain amino acid transport system permease protein
MLRPVHRDWLTLGALALALLIAPWLLSGYLVSILVFSGIYAIAAIGLSLLAGYAGQVSLGQAAFFGIGAYTSALLATRLQLSPWVGLVAASLVAGAVAWAIGALLLRLRGHYLAIGTLGFGIIVHILMLEWIPLTGGPSGFGQIPTLALPGYPLRSDRDYYYLVLACVVVVVVLALNLVRSRIGRALRGLHASEIAAETLGLGTANLKLRVFVLSAVFAACAGGLYAHYVSYISPAPFTFTVSIELLVMAAVGGLSSVWGALFGSALILGLIEAIKAWLPLVLPQASGEQELILYGLILIVVMICMPDGVIGTLEQRRSRRRPTTEDRQPARALERIERTADQQPAATVGGPSSMVRRQPDE